MPQPPRRIGLIGLDREAFFHLERIGCRHDLSVVAVFGCEANTASIAPHRAVVCRTMDELAGQQLDWVLVTSPITDRERAAGRLLELGCDVAMTSPVFARAETLRELLNRASALDRRLVILPHEPIDTGFASAVAATAGGRMGTIRSARLISWGELIDEFESPKAPGPEAVFRMFGFRYINQLLRLTSDEPVAVSARIAEDDSLAFTFSIQFVAGAEALIDVRRSSAVTLHTGWVLACEQGGFADGRAYRREPSGEIAEEDIPTMVENRIDQYRELLAEKPAKTGESASAAIRILTILEAAIESSRRLEPVRLNSNGGG